MTFHCHCSEMTSEQNLQNAKLQKMPSKIYKYKTRKWCKESRTKINSSGEPDILKLMYRPVLAVKFGAKFNIDGNDREAKLQKCLI